MKFIYENLNEDTLELEEKDVTTLLRYILEDLVDLRGLMKSKGEHRNLFKDADVIKYEALCTDIDAGRLYTECKSFLSDIKTNIPDVSITGMNLSAIFEEGEADWWECIVQDPEADSVMGFGITYACLKKVVENKLNELGMMLSNRDTTDDMIKSMYELYNRINTSGCKYLATKHHSKIAHLAEYMYNCNTEMGGYLVFEKKHLVFPECEQSNRDLIDNYYNHIDSEVEKIWADLESGYDVVSIIEEHSILGLSARYR